MAAGVVPRRPCLENLVDADVLPRGSIDGPLSAIEQLASRVALMLNHQAASSLHTLISILCLAEKPGHLVSNGLVASQHIAQPRTWSLPRQSGHCLCPSLVKTMGTQLGPPKLATLAN